MAAACSDGVLRFWAAQSGGLAAVSAAQPHRSAMGSACSWHPDGFAVASVGTDGTIAVLVGALPYLADTN